METVNKFGILTNRERELNEFNMPEQNLSSEAQEMLPKAVEDITRLYMGDQLADLLRNQSPEMRDGFWEKAAIEHSPFTENIRKLRESLKAVGVTKNAYPEPITVVMGMNFSEVSNKMTQTFLTNILFARTTRSPGYMDYDIEPYEEAEVMVRELGIQDGLRGQQIKTISLDQAVGAVLTGSLRVSYQKPELKS